MHPVDIIVLGDIKTQLFPLLIDANVALLDSFWQLATDAIPPQEATELAEDLGIEFDTAEHTAIERGRFCSPASALGKRRR